MSLKLNMIETKNFIIRQAALEDIEDFIAFWNDEKVMKYIADGTWGGDEKVVTAYLKKCIEGYKLHPELGYWVVVDKKTNRVIGEAGLSPITETKEIEAGYLLHQNYWGKGFGTELLTNLIEHGFKKLKLKKIIAVAHPENKSSIKIMEKCGMKFEKMDTYHNRYSVKYSIFY